MSVVRSPVRSVVRSPVRGVFGGVASLLDDATSYLNGVTPYHYADFISNRMLYAGVDVGTVAGGTGYSFTRASQGYYTNADGTLTLFASGAMRRGDRGVLIEGARTNLLLRSQEFDNASWVKTRATVTANAVAAPDGTLTAEKLVEDSTASNSHFIAQSPTLTAAAHTFTVYAKAAERSYIGLFIGTVGVGKYFDLANGAVLGNLVGAPTSAAIEALGNGWYRCSIVFTGTAAPNAASVYLSPDGTSISYNGDNASGVYLWGAQLEAASFPSSYIPTTTTSAIRQADVLTYTAGVSYPLTVWAEFERAVDTGGGEYWAQIDDGSNNNRVLVYGNTLDQVAAFMNSGGVTQAETAVAGAVAVNAVTKFAARFDTNSVRGCRAGTLSTEDTSATLPAAPTRWQIGNPTPQPFGYIRRAAVFNSALTDAQLTASTT